MTTGLPAALSGTASNWTWPARCWPSAPCCSSCSPRRPCSRWRGCSRASGKASRRCWSPAAPPRWQLVRLTAVEAAPLLRSQRGGGRAGLHRPGPAARRERGGPVRLAYLLGAAAVGAGALVIMLVPVLSTVTRGAAWARRGRQSGAIAGVTRGGAEPRADPAGRGGGLAAAALLGGVGRGQRDHFGVDPVIVAASTRWR